MEKKLPNAGEYQIIPEFLMSELKDDSKISKEMEPYVQHLQKMAIDRAEQLRMAAESGCELVEQPVPVWNPAPGKDSQKISKVGKPWSLDDPAAVI